MKTRVVELRLIGTDADITEAVAAVVAAADGPTRVGVHLGRRKATRNGDGRFVQYGTLILVGGSGAQV